MNIRYQVPDKPFNFPMLADVLRGREEIERERGNLGVSVLQLLVGV